jgi:hypothetical protein
MIITMNTEPKSKWDEEKEMLKLRIAALTHDDLRFDLRKIEEMLELLHIKFDKTIEDANKIIDELK